MSLALTNKVCLVTGASSGIGLATAVAFAKQGARVALVGRNPEALQSAAVKCCEAAGKPETEFLLKLQADVSLEVERERIIKQTVDHFGNRLDVLVNNAGTFLKGACHEPGLMEAYDKIFEVNVKAPLHLIHLSVPYLTASKGSVVNVGSIAGSRVIPDRIAYSMSKAALHQMTQCAALELASKGIRVNGVSPGLIKTDFLEKCGLNEQEREAMYARAAQTHPLGRAGESEDVADTILFLASEASRFTTGAIIPVDGGRHATCLR